MIRSRRKEGASLYLEYRVTIDQAICTVARRQRSFGFDAEDFASTVHIHFIKDNFGVLRRFRGQSSLKTYVLSVVTHLAQDWRNRLWGKWRSSAGARRQGPVVMHLERLIRRDGLSFDEAYETLRTNFSVAESRAHLEAIASKLPARARRQLVGDHLLDEAPAAGQSPSALAEWKEATNQARTVITLMRTAIGALSADDVLLLRLRFAENMRIVDIARTVNLDQKSLYRRIDRILVLLRTALEGQGLTAYTARDLLERRGFDAADDSALDSVSDAA